MAAQRRNWTREETNNIKPRKDSDIQTERTNSCNGLCLNALHDKAFDRHKILLLDRFLPGQNFIEYHNDVVFMG